LKKFKILGAISPSIVGVKSMNALVELCKVLIGYSGRMIESSVVKLFMISNRKTIVGIGSSFLSRYINLDKKNIINQTRRKLVARQIIELSNCMFEIGPTCCIVDIVYWPEKQFTLLLNSMVFGTRSLADKVNQKVKSSKFSLKH